MSAARLLLLAATPVHGYYGYYGGDASCPSTCYSGSCDYWYGFGYTCDDFASWSCNCDGCDNCGSPAPPPLSPSPPYWSEFSSGEWETEQATLAACVESGGLGINGSSEGNMSANIILDGDSPAAPFYFTDAAAGCAPGFSGSGPVQWLRLNDVRPGIKLSLSTCDPDSSLDTDLAVFRGGCGALDLVNCSGDARKVETSICQKDHSALSFARARSTTSSSVAGGVA